MYRYISSGEKLKGVRGYFSGKSSSRYAVCTPAIRTFICVYKYMCSEMLFLLSLFLSLSLSLSSSPAGISRWARDRESQDVATGSQSTPRRDAICPPRALQRSRLSYQFNSLSSYFHSSSSSSSATLVSPRDKSPSSAIISSLRNYYEIFYQWRHNNKSRYRHVRTEDSHIYIFLYLLLFLFITGYKIHWFEKKISSSWYPFGVSVTRITRWQQTTFRSSITICRRTISWNLEN